MSHMSYEILKFWDNNFQRKNVHPTYAVREFPFFSISFLFLLFLSPVDFFSAPFVHKDDDLTHLTINICYPFFILFSSFLLLFKSIFQGAIFREDQRDSFYDLAFKFAVHKINKDPRILPKSLLTYDIQYVDKDDSFHANKQGLYDDDLCPIHGCTVLHMSTMVW